MADAHTMTMRLRFNVIGADFCSTHIPKAVAANQ
jgi:hypothetical protein